MLMLVLILIPTLLPSTSSFHFHHFHHHHNSDLLSDFITLYSVQVARLPADEDHPYG
jgi:hypothetical protein